jgi:hypothetical protein
MNIDRDRIIADILRPYRAEGEHQVAREYGRELRAASDDRLIREARFNGVTVHTDTPTA